LSIVIRTINYSITGEIGVPGEKGFKGSKGEMVSYTFLCYEWNSSACYSLFWSTLPNKRHNPVSGEDHNKIQCVLCTYMILQIFNNCIAMKMYINNKNQSKCNRRNTLNLEKNHFKNYIGTLPNFRRLCVLSEITIHVSNAPMYLLWWVCLNIFYGVQ